ncbi:Fc.00g034470.m01.CDS01 [Cosmosporella sp. VM-42]
MGFLSKTVFSSLLGTSSLAAYLAARNPVISPLASADPIWTSKIYKRFNPNSNPATQDICIKRIPLSKIRPELLKNEGDLALEFCRGVWSGLGFTIQRQYLDYKYRGPETAHQLWSQEQLSQSSYERGTCITDHFEVVEKTPNAITVRCGDSPRNQELRASDGLFIISATIDEKRGEVELGLKSCLFSSKGKVSGFKGPMPPWMEELHQWYARIWAETGSRRLLK